MVYAQQILFVLILGISGFFLAKRISRIRKNILLGLDFEPRGDSFYRLKTMLLVAFGQRKMFKSFIPAFLHLFIYVGFIVINFEVLEFIIDGIVGSHRIFAPFLGDFYNVLMNIFEFLAIGVLVACLIFLFRRNVLKVKRFTQPEMKAWPRLDANLILLTEIVLMVAILSMNTADQLLQSRNISGYVNTGTIFFSRFLMPLFSDMSDTGLILMERFAWWFHIIGILGFAIYITYSKHLHIFLAFPNTYYSDPSPMGKIISMDSVTKEVKIMLGMASGEDISPPPDDGGRFGAKDINDLTWKNLLDAYSCTECGRCTAVCPANQTGKKLSPRKIMMDVRDRADEVGRSLESGGSGLEDGKNLLGDYILKEEINACTSCNACVDACPVLINPLNIIIELRRYMVMEESGSPAAWNSMFQNIETNFAPWKFAPSDRFNWAND